ncbi:hypothetical protein HDV05_005641, partial [Chytridiales sp. JEL 0842]
MPDRRLFNLLAKSLIWNRANAHQDSNAAETSCTTAHKIMNEGVDGHDQHEAAEKATRPLGDMKSSTNRELTTAKEPTAKKQKLNK